MFVDSDSVIFHEMCHALHRLAVKRKPGALALNYIYKTNIKKL